MFFVNDYYILRTQVLGILIIVFLFKQYQTDEYFNVQVY